VADRLRGHLCRTGQPPAGRPSVPRGISRSVDPGDSKHMLDISYRTDA
jgi:hypothetical protein